MLPPLYAGQPISATLTIETSFHWAPVEDMDKKSYVMRFDVEEMTMDWLVSGMKRGDFVAKVRMAALKSSASAHQRGLGRPIIPSTRHSHRAPSWRAFSAQGRGTGLAYVGGRSWHAVCRGSQLRDSPTTRRREGFGTTSGRENDICN